MMPRQVPGLGPALGERACQLMDDAGRRPRLIGPVIVAGVGDDEVAPRGEDGLQEEVAIFVTRVKTAAAIVDAR